MLSLRTTELAADKRVRGGIWSQTWEMIASLTTQIPVGTSTGLRGALVADTLWTSMPQITKVCRSSEPTVGTVNTI